MSDLPNTPSPTEKRENAPADGRPTRLSAFPADSTHISVGAGGGGGAVSTAASANRFQPRRLVLIGCLAYCVSPWGQPGIALALGMVLALLGLIENPGWSKLVSRRLIQACVILLGFRMNLGELLHAGASGFLFAMGTIVATFALGIVIGKLIGAAARLTTLLSAGTAICGGSAIAAVGSVIGATASEMSVAIGTVFILNAVALYVFPLLGEAMQMSQAQFGTWAAVAIHDVSSVVGAAKQFGDEALSIATAVKLSRTLWIAPIAMIAAWWFARRAAIDAAAGADDAGAAAKRAAAKTPIPWFIAWFIVASAVRTVLERAGATIDFGEVDAWVKRLAVAGMSAALLLIGASLSRKTLASVGWRALVLGVTLWVFISVASLMVVRATIE